MTEEDQIVLSNKFNRWFRGDEDAMRLAALLTEAAHYADDVADGTPVPPAEGLRICRVMLLEIPSNHFYRRNFEFMQPLMAQCWLSWHASATLESDPVALEDVSYRAKCYMLRASLYGLYHGMAVLTGGLDWAQEVGPEIWLTYGENMENFYA